MAAAGTMEDSRTAWNRLGTRNKRCLRMNEDSVENVDGSTIDNKINFFRVIGLKIRKICNVDCLDDSCTTDNNNNVKQFNDVRKMKLVDNGLSCQSKMECQRNKETNDSDESNDPKREIKNIKECSVMITGAKCWVCGKGFKCIKDVQLHVRKKHKKKKPKTKVVLLKIGNEVISRLPIRKKHLKRVELGNDPEILKSYETEENSWIEDISKNDARIIEGRLVPPLIDLEDVSEIRDIGSDEKKTIMQRNVPLNILGFESTALSNQCVNLEEEEEEIREVLRITRSQNVGLAINHETPNRMERELLLSDAIRELDMMENESIKIIEYVDNAETLKNIGNLNLVENHYTYGMENDCYTDFSLKDTEPLGKDFNLEYFEDEPVSLNSEEYRRENGDVVPDFIDYSQCLFDDRRSINNNSIGKENQNGGKTKGSELESPFYNEARINEWKQLTRVPNTFNSFDVHHCCQTSDNRVVIKEEIMLDDLM